MSEMQSLVPLNGIDKRTGLMFDRQNLREVARWFSPRSLVLGASDEAAATILWQMVHAHRKRNGKWPVNRLEGGPLVYFVIDEIEAEGDQDLSPSPRYQITFYGRLGRKPGLALAGPELSAG